MSFHVGTALLMLRVGISHGLCEVVEKLERNSSPGFLQ